MIKVSAQTFATASRRKSDINIGVSDLFDNLHSLLRFYRNNQLSGRHRNNYFLNESAKLRALSTKNVLACQRPVCAYMLTSKRTILSNANSYIIQVC